MFNCARQAIDLSVRRFLCDEGGATAIEYALIASGIALAIVTVVTTLGSNVKGLYSSVATAME